jgi:rubrerythrin
MTNAEKFVEVFGTDLKQQYATKSWWDQEFVPVKTGHWIESRCDMYECSECGHTYTDLSGERYGMNYCPVCGAKMVEPQESEEQS